jgi:hypothetical protein
MIVNFERKTMQITMNELAELDCAGLLEKAPATDAILGRTRSAKRI